MLLETLFALMLFQTPAAQTPPAPAAPEAAPAPAPGAAPPAQGRRERAELGCENRPRTGSVMTRRICRTPRRAEAERTDARTYVGQITAGTANEPPPQ